MFVESLNSGDFFSGRRWSVASPHSFFVNEWNEKRIWYFGILKNWRWRINSPFRQSYSREYGILPLIVSSLISGMASLDIRSSKRIGIITTIYYLLTMVFSSILGVILVIAIHPGSRFTKEANATKAEEQKSATSVSTLDTFLDLIRQFSNKNQD